MFTRKKPLPPIGTKFERPEDQNYSNKQTVKTNTPPQESKTDNKEKQELKTIDISVAAVFDSANSAAQPNISRKALASLPKSNKYSELDLQSLANSGNIEQLVSLITSANEHTRSLIAGILKEQANTPETQDEITANIELHASKAQDAKVLECYFYIISNISPSPTTKSRVRTCYLNITTALMLIGQSNGEQPDFSNNLINFFNEALSHKDAGLRVKVLTIISNFLVDTDNCKQLINLKLLQKVTEILSNSHINIHEFNFSIDILSTLSQRHPESIDAISLNIKHLNAPSGFENNDLHLNKAINLLERAHAHDETKLINQALIKLLASAITSNNENTSDSAIKLLRQLIPKLPFNLITIIFYEIRLEPLLRKANHNDNQNHSENILLLLTELYSASKRVNFPDESSSESDLFQAKELIRGSINSATPGTMISYKIINYLFSYLKNPSPSVNVSTALFLIAGLARGARYNVLIYNRNGAQIILDSFDNFNNFDLFYGLIIYDSFLKNNGIPLRQLCQAFVNKVFTSETKRHGAHIQTGVLILISHIINVSDESKKIVEQHIESFDIYHYLESSDPIVASRAISFIATFAKDNNRTPSFYTEKLANSLLKFFFNPQTETQIDATNAIIEILFNHPELIDLFKSERTTRQLMETAITCPPNRLSENMQSTIQQFITVASSNNYSQLEAIGRGGYGSVYKIQNKQTGELVAAKCPHKISEDRLRALATEAKILKAITHPYIISFKGLFFHEDGKPPMVMMGYAEGGNLKKKIHSRTDFSWGTRVQYILGALIALQYLHLNNYIHRDIKPANIVIQDNKAKLADLEGVQKATLKSGLMGTPGYRAPEMLDNSQKHNTLPTDMWAFAITLLELITRTAPCKENTNPNFRQLLLSGEFSSTIPSEIPGMPNGLDKIVIQATMFAPEDRSTAKEARHALEYIRSTMT